MCQSGGPASLIRKNEEMESESFLSIEKHIFFLNFLICFRALFWDTCASLVNELERCPFSIAD
jgi:hypothetical protein